MSTRDAGKSLSLLPSFIFEIVELDFSASVCICFCILISSHSLILIAMSTPNRNDGEEPDFMAVNPTDWLSSTMEACCNRFFGGFMYDICMGRYPPDQDDCNTMLFYPDWNGSNKGCLDDGK